MRLVYVDEAGISSKAHEPFTVVAGVIVHADHDLVRLEAALDAIVNRHIPPHQRVGFVFHATELFNGGGKVFRRDSSEWPLQGRLEVANELAGLIVEFDLPVAYGFCERAKQNSLMTFAHGELPSAVMTSFANMIYGVDCWVRKNTQDEICMLVIEESSCTKPIINNQWEEHRGRANRIIKKIKEGPLFEKKRPSSVLQLADFCAYVIKKILMKNQHYYVYAEMLNKQVHAVLDAWPPRRDG